MALDSTSYSEIAVRQDRVKTLIQISAPLLHYISRTLDPIPHLTCLFDSDGFIVDLHYSREFSNMVDGTDMKLGARLTEAEFGENAIARCLRLGRAVKIIGQEHDSDAFARWACYASPLRDGNDSIVGGIGISLSAEYAQTFKLCMLHMVTDAIESELRRLQARHELELAQAQWNAIIQGLDQIGGCALAIVDKDGHFLMANKEMAYAIGGTKPDLFLQKNVSGVFEDDLLVMHTLRDKIPRNSTIIREDVSGKRRIWKVTAIPVLDQGEAVASLIFGVDFTEMSYTQEYLKELQTQSERYQIMGEVIHEIRNPLTAIHAQAQVAHKLSRESSTKERLSKIVDQVDRLSSLLTSLLKPGQPIYEHWKQSELADLPLTVESVVDFFRPKCEQRHIRLRFIYDGSECFGQFPSKLITQVLSNLLTNAIDAVDDCERKNIDVSLETLPDRVAISVQDSGIGIPKDLIPRVFERNFSTKKTGAGLGLPVVREIVENSLSGVIKTQSCPGQGSIFRVELPRQKHLEKL